MRTPNFRVIEETDEFVLIKDVGPWDLFPTVTNGAERVVELLWPSLHGRRLEYIDSQGERDEIIVKDGQFVGFKVLREK